MSIATKDNEARQVSLSQVVGEIAWRDELVPLEQLPPTYGPEPSRAMLQSVREVGILTPVLLVRSPRDGSYEVLDGLRRIWAAREAGLAEIPARVAAGASGGNAILTLITNEQRSTNPVSEYRSITTLVDDRYGETEISRLTGMPIQTIRKRMRIANLITQFFEMFELGDLPAALAEELAKLPEGEQREAYRRWCEGEKLTHGLLQDVRAVRREHAVMDLLPGLEDSDEEDASMPIVHQGRALVLIDRIRVELQRAGDVDVIRSIDRLLGELEGELNRGGA